MCGQRAWLRPAAFAGKNTQQQDKDPSPLTRAVIERAAADAAEQQQQQLPEAGPSSQPAKQRKRAAQAGATGSGGRQTKQDKRALEQVQEAAQQQAQEAVQQQAQQAAAPREHPDEVAQDEIDLTNRSAGDQRPWKVCHCRCLSL